MEKASLNKVLENNKIKRPILKNAIKAFIIGGLICLSGQLLIYIFKDLCKFEKKESGILMYIVVIGITAILTGFGLFDKLGQFAGAGTLVPITGFSNSMTSAALESKSEGIVLGIMTNMFKLAGAVIATGVVSAVIFGLVFYLLRV